MKFLKPLKPLIVLPICLLTMAQCGLEYLPFLTAPISLGQAGKTFSVRKSVANDSESALEWEYRGIELYYKFYLPTDPPENNLTELSELTTKKFHRISSPADDVTRPVQKPLIDGTALAGDVDFIIDMENIKITETSTPLVVYSDIRRGIPYGSTDSGYPNFKQFLNDDFIESDDDVGKSINDYITNNPFSEIKMVMYAFSYGKKDYSVDLYSEAEYLGEIQVNFGW